MERYKLPQSPEARAKRKKHAENLLAGTVLLAVAGGLGAGIAYAAEQTAISNADKNQKWSDDADKATHQLDLDSGKITIDVSPDSK